jgi:FMN phosphatase YigB (HAD superfamily)
VKLYRWPERAEALLFDIDGTLYSDKAYGDWQIESQIICFAEYSGLGLEAARKLVEENSFVQGKKISLGNALMRLGVSIEKSVEWRKEKLDPFVYLRRNPELQELFGFLGKKFALGALTNNPRSVGLKTLDALGLGDCFSFVVGLDDGMESKPSRKALQIVQGNFRMNFDRIVSIGDRYDVDLALPLELGMGALLVDGPDDILAFFGGTGEDSPWKKSLRD